MANIFLKETAHFKPFSYKEMLAPIEAYAKERDAQEDAIDALETTAADAAFDFKGSSYEDMYNNYINSLSSIANNISSGNISGDTRKQIRDARRTFTQTLAPAQKRIKKYRELVTKQDEEQSDNPYVRFSVDYRKLTEDDVNANSSYTAYDLNKIYKKVAENTIDKISSDYRPLVGEPTLIEGTNSYMIKHGYGMTQEEFSDAMKDTNSDVYQFIEEEVKKATKGIENKEIIAEIIPNVGRIVQSNIGKFQTERVTAPKDTDNALGWAKLELDRQKFLAEYEPVESPDGTVQWIKKEGSSTSSGYKKDEDIDPYFSFKNLPTFPGGTTTRIKSTDIDNKLRKDSNKPDVTQTIEGVKKTGLKKYNYAELVSMGIKNIDMNEITRVVGGNIENAKYYDFYYEDTGFRGGVLHAVKKTDDEIKGMIYNERVSNKRKEIAGIKKTREGYYYTDMNGRILLDPYKKGLKLTDDEMLAYRPMIENLKVNSYVRINAPTTPNTSSPSVGNSDSSENDV